jgi:hypothetical protein
MIVPMLGTEQSVSMLTLSMPAKQALPDCGLHKKRVVQYPYQVLRHSRTSVYRAASLLFVNQGKFLYQLLSNKQL